MQQALSASGSVHVYSLALTSVPSHLHAVGAAVVQVDLEPVVFASAFPLHGVRPCISIEKKKKRWNDEGENEDHERSSEYTDNLAT